MRVERGTFVARETIQGIWIIHHVTETSSRHNELFSSEYRDSRKDKDNYAWDAKQAAASGDNLIVCPIVEMVQP